MKRISVFILACIAVFSLEAMVSAEDIYVAQTAQGSNTGADASNAHSMTWLNESGNWGAGVDKVSPSDTIHLVGTLTSILTIQASGSSGSVITILFESGAKFSKNTWGAGNAAITMSSKSYITINGGTNGVIEATDNGTALTYQDDERGVYINSGTSIIVNNLTFNNLFVRTPGTDGGFGSNGVRMEGTSTSISIHDNEFNYMNASVYLAYGGSSDDVDIYNNVFNHGANGMVVGNSGASTLTNLKMHDNVINLYDDGSDSACGNIFHVDGLQFFAQTAGSSITDAEVYNNTVGPNMGICAEKTGWIFLEGIMYGTKIYNNLLLLGSGVKAPANGFIYDKAWSGGTKATEIYNNTIVSNSQQGTGLNVPEEDVTIYNNILINLNYAVYSLSSGYSVDYNLYYNNNTNGHTDTHGVTSNPSLDANYKPSSGSSPVVGAGTNLTSLGITTLDSDKAGVARPSSGAWDIGAFQMQASTTSAAQTPTSLRIIP